MAEETNLRHIALEYKEKKHADVFYKEILGLDILKDFVLPSDLSKKIFGINEKVDVFVYGNNAINFEIFITNRPMPKRGFDHICIGVYDKDDFVEKCKKSGLKPFFVNKDDRKLLFVKDFSKNLYEIKENK